MKGVVSKIHLNDLDDGIYSFWYSILNYKDEFVELINNTDVNVENWRIQKEIYNSGEQDALKLGFSTFFLNRCNRSGILNAGVIGGLKQEGKYKIHDRFNKEKLIEIIELIHAKKNDILIYKKRVQGIYRINGLEKH